MKVRGSIRSPGLVRGAVVGFVAAMLVVAGATAASAQGLSPDRDRAEDAATGQVTMREAMERDLGLTGAALDEFLAQAAAATELDAQLQEELGQALVSSRFDAESGTLQVAVTTARAAERATDAGAEAARVSHRVGELAAITDALDARVEDDPGALSGVYSWGIEAERNQVVVTVAEGQAGSVQSLVAEYGNAVAIEESAHQPQVAQAYPWLDGGIPYNGCSTGFNVRNTSTGDRYFLTAGHCGNAGDTATAGNGVTIGTFTSSFFPSFDDALVQVTNTSFWLQGPFVWTWPGFISVSGFTDAPVGTPICKSGRTTGYTCGTITAKDQTVNYPQGTVFGLTRHNACVEPGDSGGSNVNVSGATNRAEGMTSGASLIAGQCLSTPVSWYFPIADSLSYYGSVYGVTLY